MDECGWEKDDALCKGLRALTDCNAIRKISRGVYQINPQYAGRGKWRYDARENQGGIENLIAAFNFRDKSVSTSITWASANPNEIGNNIKQVVATHTEMTDQEPLQGPQKAEKKPKDPTQAQGKSGAT